MSDICFDACTCGSVVVSSAEDVVDYITALREANESLRAEVERLREALEQIASGKFSGIVLTSFPPQDPAVNFARAAIAGESE